MAFGSISVDKITDSEGSVFSPSSALFRNRIINGDMRIDQRNAGAAVTNANGYVVDRILSQQYGGATGRWTGQQVSDAPANFINSYKITVTTTDSAPSANYAYVYAEQRIEGFNTADLSFGTANAKTVTLSFWVKSSITGTFSVVLGNASGNRFYASTYTISSANTWEYKTVTISGDTTGTWETTTSTGILVRFGQGGSSVSISPGSWTAPASGSIGATGVTNLMATNSATWQITGVQLEVGSVATPFERRPFGTELALCQRYYQKLTSTASGQPFALGGVTSSTAGRAYTQFMVIMRAAPSALETNGTASDYSVLSGPGAIVLNAAPAFESATVNGIQVSWTVASGATTGYYAFLRAATANGGYLAWSAEL
jgi:hypothetical protein